MNGTPAARSRSIAASVFASCISANVPSCIRAPPDDATTTSGIRAARACSAARVTFSPTTAPIEPPMNPKSMTQSATSVRADVGRAPHGGVAHPGRGLRRGQSVRVRLLVDEAERVDRLQAGVPLVHDAVVGELLDSGRRREPEVVAADRADAHRLVELLVEEHLLAGRALRPQIRRVDVPLRPERGNLMGGIRRASRARRPERHAPSAVAGRVRHQATNAAPASDRAAEVSAPPMSSGRTRSGFSSSGPSNRRSSRGSRVPPATVARSPNGTIVPSPPAACWTRIDAAISARFSATRSSNRNDGW